MSAALLAFTGLTKSLGSQSFRRIRSHDYIYSLSTRRIRSWTTKTRSLCSMHAASSQPFGVPSMILQAQVLQQTRSLAHITGHKKTNKKNKKKAAAIYKLKAKKEAPKARRQTQPKKRAGQPPQIDHSTLPDYPVPREFQSSQNKKLGANVTAPPVLMDRTASPFVFVAKAAKVDPQSLFRSTDVFGSDGSNSGRGGAYDPFSPSDFKNNNKSSSPYPCGDQPEVCFLGRSNVGKSSLINALIQRPLAVTSKRPGRTQQAHYYGWVPHHHRTHAGRNNLALSPSLATGFIVDLPGYGYAVGPDKAVEGWQQATQAYLVERRDAGNLRRLYLLQDARLAAPQDIDATVCAWLDEAEIPYTVVLTKADGGSGSPGVVKHANLCCMRYQLQRSEFLQAHSVMVAPTVHVTSSTKRQGLEELLHAVQREFLAPAGQRTDEYEEYYQEESESDDDDDQAVQEAAVAGDDVYEEFHDEEGMRRVAELNAQRKELKAKQRKVVARLDLRRQKSN